MSSVTVRVPAKVNLQLSVGGPRSDGYHDVATVFHAVGLYDDVTALTGDHLTVSVEGEGADLVPTDETNLALVAAQVLAEHAGVEARAHLHIRRAYPSLGGWLGEARTPPVHSSRSTASGGLAWTAKNFSRWRQKSAAMCRSR